MLQPQTPTVKNTAPNHADAAPADAAHVAAVGVAQNLHAMIVEISHNDVALAVKGDSEGMVELASALAFAADGPQANAVAASQHLRANTLRICNNKNTAQHLQAMVRLVHHHNIALVVQRHQPRAIELSDRCALAAKGAQEGGTIWQHVA